MARTNATSPGKGQMATIKNGHRTGQVRTFWIEPSETKSRPDNRAELKPLTTQ